MEQLKQEKMAQYAAWQRPLSDEGALQEVVATYVAENLLTDEKSIVEMAQHNPTLVQKIVNFFDSLLAKLGVKGSKERTEIRRMRDTYFRALQQARAGYGVSTDATMARMGQAYGEGAMTEADFDDAVDAVMEDESAAGMSMLEGDPLGRQSNRDKVQYSITQIEGERGSYGTGVLLDTDLFNGTSPRNWGRVLSDYVYKNLAGTELTMYDDVGNAETVYLARTNDRVRKDGANRSHKVIDKLARYRGDNKALELSRWMNSQGWTSEQISVAKEYFKYYSMIPAEASNYDSFTAVGISDNAAYTLAEKLGALKPETGKDSVSSLQKYRVVVNSGMSERDQMSALGTLMQEGEFAKLQTANKHGVAPDIYVDFKETLPRYDADSNGNYSQKEAEAAIDSMGIRDNEWKAVLWQMTNTGWKPKNNPYSQKVGQQIYDAMH